MCGLAGKRERVWGKDVLWGIICFPRSQRVHQCVLAWYVDICTRVKCVSKWFLPCCPGHCSGWMCWGSAVRDGVAAGASLLERGRALGCVLARQCWNPALADPQLREILLLHVLRAGMCQPDLLVPPRAGEHPDPFNSETFVRAPQHPMSLYGCWGDLLTSYISIRGCRRCQSLPCSGKVGSRLKK